MCTLVELLNPVCYLNTFTPSKYTLRLHVTVHLQRELTSSEDDVTTENDIFISSFSITS